jgi:tRNA A-37 threonylcarbamoyl transferase component Bud32
MLSYIIGTAGHYPLKPYVLSESTLIRLALLLRQFHDATISFSLPENFGWQNPIIGKREVICHGDAGPYNIIFRNSQPVALIDFERATPGPRIWDIAFVLYRFAPLIYSSPE